MDKATPDQFIEEVKLIITALEVATSSVEDAQTAAGVSADSAKSLLTRLAGARYDLEAMVQDARKRFKDDYEHILVTLAEWCHAQGRNIEAEHAPVFEALLEEL